MTPLGASLRRLYLRALPSSIRDHIYKLRHRRDFRNLRQAVYPSPRGAFSLRAFDECQSIFVHIPKTAGVSVALSLFGYMPYHYTALDYRLIYGSYIFRKYFKFAFVRNPWDRLFSAYRFLLAGGWNEDDRRWAEENIAHFDGFSEFVEQWLTPQTALRMIHFRPQWHFVCDRKRNILLNYLGYMETINEDFLVVTRRLRIEASLQHRNANPSQTNYRDEYSDRARAIVGEVYKSDIKLFGYDFGEIQERRMVQ